MNVVYTVESMNVVYTAERGQQSVAVALSNKSMEHLAERITIVPMMSKTSRILQMMRVN